MASESNAAGFPHTDKQGLLKDLSPEYALYEGESRNLGYWKKVHWEYYTNEIGEHGKFQEIGYTVISASL